MVAAVTISLSCDKLRGEYPIASDIEYTDTQVEPDATIITPILSKAPFEGPVNGTTFTPSTDKIFGITAYLGSDIPTSWVKNSQLDNEPVNSDQYGNYIFNEKKYYPKDDKIKMYFYAYSPMVNCDYTQGDGTQHPKVTYNLTGREDILWSKNDTGIGKNLGVGKQPQPDFQFTHKLQRVMFSIRRTDKVASKATLSEIRINNLNTKAILDLITGELTFEDSDKNYLSVAYNKNITTSYFDIPYDLMFQADIRDLDITVVIDGILYNGNVTLAGDNAGKAGYKHLLRMTIDGTVLQLNAPQIVDWESYSTQGNI